jgi:integrase
MDDIGFQQNTEAIADGIVIYRRSDHRDARWQMRMKLERGYWRQSTGKRDKDAARNAALAIAFEIGIKLKHNLPLRDTVLKVVAEQFIGHMHNELTRKHMKHDRVKFLEGTLRRYIIPYFGQMMLADITVRDIDRYREWRKDAGRKGNADRRNIPKGNTLRFEESTLRQMFKFAVREGLADAARVPAFESPKNSSDRRPGLTAVQLAHLRSMMDTMVAEATHGHVKRKRQLLRAYVDFMVETGLRVGEARELKWRDIEAFTTRDGVQTLRLWVSGKTKKQPAIAQPNAMLALDAIKAFGQKLDQDDYVFTLDGAKVMNFGNGFTAVLKRAGLLHDTDGAKRTVYSLRHTYATLRLDQSAPIFWLAENMRTSVAMIEKHYAHTKIGTNADAGIGVRMGGS